MYWTNYNSHSKYCSGSDEMETYLHEAISQRLKVFGFSSHAPLPFTARWSLNYAQVAEYLAKASHLKQKFQDLIQVYIGMEVDYIPSVIGPTSEYIKTLRLEYIIGAVHFVDRFDDGHPWQIDTNQAVFERGLRQIFKGNIKKAVRQYYELIRQMLQEQCPEITAHLDRIKRHNYRLELFDESEKWYQREVIKTLKVLADSGSILEVNTRGMYKHGLPEVYPSPWILAEAQRLNIPIMMNSDANRPEENSKLFAETAALLEDIGFKQMKILLDGRWQARNFDRNGIDFGD